MSDAAQTSLPQNEFPDPVADPVAVSGGSSINVPQTQMISVMPSSDGGPSQVEPPVMAPAADVADMQTNSSSQSYRSVIDLLVNNGTLTQDQVVALQVEQVNTGKSLEALILEHSLVSETSLTQAKATFYNIPFVTLADTGVSPEAISLVPESVARRYKLLPFMIDKMNKTLSVAMVNPLDLAAIDFVQKKTNFSLQPYYASPSEIERSIAERYAQSLSSEVTAALKETKYAAKQEKPLENLQSLTKEVVREAPITKIVETILGFAIKSRASDIHVEPQEDHTRVRYRIDGILSEKLILPRSVHEALLSRVKIMSQLKIDEKRLPQDGRITFSADGEEVDLRVSTLPTVHGEKVVMRLLKKNASVPSLSELGLRDQALREVEQSIVVPHGIVIISGPTGSGKTTTLYSILHKINTNKVNISTLEDPVEYQIGGVNQVQINPQAGLTFANGLRAFLRQDPNIIMVGEIRDSETADLAIQASLTGHLVFSTLHTNSAAGVLPRLLDMEVEPFLLASSLTLAMAQRVVRQINPEYREEYVPDPVVAEDIKNVLGDHYTTWCKRNNKDPDKLVLYRAKTDRPETEPEYLGRIAIFEVMRISEQISKMILEKKSAADIEKVGIEQGMILMKQDGYIKALEGTTTIEEVLRVAEI